MYFSDHSHSSGRLFSLRVSEDDQYNYQIQELMKKQLDERIQGVTFNPVSDTLYWTNQKQQQIMSWNMSNAEVSQPKEMLTFGDEVPTGISVDYCRGRLYWTNTNGIKATIESVGLDGKDHKVLINEKLVNPNTIVVDPFEGRLYWTDVSKGSYFKLESAALDGSDRKMLVNMPTKEPTGIAIDEGWIYLTEPVYKEILRVNKRAAKTQETVVSFKHPTVPKGIIVHDYFLDNQPVPDVCKDAVAAIKRRSDQQKASRQQNEFCLNGGTLTKPTADDSHKECQCPVGFSGRRCERDICSGFCLNGGACVIKGAVPQCECTSQYKGTHCEVDKCQNFCLNGGKCSVGKTDGQPRCSWCNTGFSGNRCELDLCANHCMNGGICNLLNGAPVCSCALGFHGAQCTDVLDKRKLICQQMCSTGAEAITAICEMCASNADLTSSFLAIAASLRASNETESTDCAYAGHSSGFNKSMVFTSFGVMGSLTLLLLIIITVYRIYKPTRPRIKKTYVVKKNNANGRLPATEQCEIIIENCCNMNICETPCFDPKTLQDETSSSPSRSKKDDKKELLKNMELNGELY